MDIYIGPLATGTTIEDVKNFLGRLGKDVNVHIVECSDGENDHRYAVAEMASEKKAAKAIKKLNGRELDDTAVVVKIYHYRATQNERRAPGWMERDWKATERRGQDRRRMSCHRKPDDDIFD
jgi:hypothetical protein